MKNRNNIHGFSRQIDIEHSIKCDRYRRENFSCRQIIGLNANSPNYIQFVEKCEN